jgi:hypothetical protein
MSELPNSNHADESLVVLHHPVLLGSETDVQQIIETRQKLNSHKHTEANR